MKIEAGKYYRTRSGRKALVLSTEGGGNDFSVYASIVLHTGKLNQPDCWRNDGLYVNADTPNGNDLVSEWVDKPVVDWSKMAAWHRWVAMDEDGNWYAYASLPELALITWRSYSFEYQRIPPNYSPAFSGDWKDSLVERPTE